MKYSLPVRKPPPFSKQLHAGAYYLSSRVYQVDSMDGFRMGRALPSKDTVGAVAPAPLLAAADLLDLPACLASLACFLASSFDAFFSASCRNRKRRVNVQGCSVLSCLWCTPLCM